MYSAQAITDERGYVHRKNYKVDELAVATGDIVKNHSRKDFDFFTARLGDLSQLDGWDLMALELIKEGLSLYSTVVYAKQGRIRVMKEVTNNKARLTCVKKGYLFHVRKEPNAPLAVMSL